MNRFFTMLFLAAVSVMTLPASSVDIDWSDIETYGATVLKFEF